MYGLSNNVTKTLLQEEDLRRMVYNFPLDEMTASLFTAIIRRYETLSEFMYTVLCNATMVFDVYEYSGTQSDIFEPAMRELMENEIVYHCSETMTFLESDSQVFDMEVIMADVGFPILETDVCTQSMNILYEYLIFVLNHILGYEKVHESRFCFVLLEVGLMSLYTAEY